MVDFGNRVRVRELDPQALKAMLDADTAMLAVDDAIEHFDWKRAGLAKPEIRLNGQPEDETRPALLWDGEWEITWVTFRDMGAAFMVALLGIYVLVVGQFRSFKLPLVILTPIPLTLVGIVAGHMMFGAPFTATSMIGFIALAGIIVRNSILLVDFVRHARRADKSLRDTLFEAGMPYIEASTVPDEIR